MNGKVVSIEDRIPKLKQERRKKTNRRIMILLFLFFLLILSILYFRSPWSKVGSITVRGNHLIATEDIIQVSGVTADTVVINIDKDELLAKIKAIPEIKTADLSLTLPNHLQITVDEYEILGVLANGDENQVLLENGLLAIWNDHHRELDVPILIGFHDEKVLDLLAGQLAALATEVKNSISEMIFTPKETDPLAVTLYMNDGFEVRATLRSFAERMNYYPDLISQLDPEEKGVLDLEVGLFFKSYESLLEPTESQETGERDESVITEESGEGSEG